MIDILKKNKLILMEGAIIEQLRRAGNVELHPTLLNAPLIYDEIGKKELKKIYQGYIDIAFAAEIPFFMCTPTWRADQSRVSEANVNQSINSLMAIVFVFIVARVVDVIIDVWGKSFAKKTESTFDDILLPLFHKLVKVIFVIITILWVLKIWNIDIGPYLAGAGILGIVIGFALQDSLKNIIGGVTLVLDKTFEIGDKVKIESGEVGAIHDIGLRSTKLVTYDNEVIYIPNGYLANSRVQNYTRPSPKVRAHVSFGVEYGSDITQVQKVVLGILEKDKEILSDPEPTVQFLEMGDSALNFKAYFWVEKWGMAYGKKLEMTEAIYNGLNKAKIGIPFPTRTVHLVK